MVNDWGGRMTMRWRMAAAGIAALVIAAGSARSEVVWRFFETSCTAVGGSNCTYQPPTGLAQLVLPDINSSGSWTLFYNHISGQVTETGDTNFSFQLVDPMSPPFLAPG